MEKYRIYVEKKEGYQVEAKSLALDFNLNLGLHIEELRLINIYDVFGFSKELLEECRYQVFGEIVTDNVYDTLDLTGKKYLAVEYLPGQFDQRASSAVACTMLVNPNALVNIKSGKLLIFDEGISNSDLEKIKKYYINVVEAREKDLSILSDVENVEIAEVKILEGFTSMKEEDIPSFITSYGLAMNQDDVAEVVRYFKSEGRNPNETELRILDTYWSDHCRHTTFNTKFTKITIEEGFIKKELEDSLDLYYKMRKELNKEDKTICLMDMACIAARYLKKNGYLDDLEESTENNACSIFVNIMVDGREEEWLLQFKNETHNHPTEIEPFGGASTCLGGAIRDPLSGRAYVYQAMRVTGAGNIYAPVSQTLHGKLPQRIISTKAASGYSSYGNQIGLATTHVREIYDDGYVAKRLEVGAVVGAVKAENIVRETPQPGDIIVLLGGRTGRDGIGGATGSSKEHNEKSIEVCSSEVQKGNAPEERKICHLFRRAEVTKLIKKSNDFGAGGVSVAIGELADGLHIYLDRIPTKYKGLNVTELAISESQERMAVVLSKESKEEFIRYANEENIEVTYVADVTADARLIMYYKDKEVVNLSREFIDSAGAMHYAEAIIGNVEERNPFVCDLCGDTKTKVLQVLEMDNVVSQKGLIEMFDSTIGTSTVLMPFGGKYQASETQVSIQKLPVDGYTDTASVMAYGYNPKISKWSPYHGAMYSVVEAVSKVVACGARYDRMRFSYQEYFEKMSSPHAWGKPLSALLGAIQIQEELHLPSIGGKDSMSGTYQDINVPPMLMAFGITCVEARNVISTDLKEAGNYLYLFHHLTKSNYTPNTKALMKLWNEVSDSIEDKKIVSAYALGFGGMIEAIAKMSFGNKVGVDISCDDALLFDLSYGSILVESKEKLEFDDVLFIGKTIKEPKLIINGESISIEEAWKANTSRFNTIYKDKVKNISLFEKFEPTKVEKKQGLNNKKEVTVFVPVFPGTNCDYDTMKAFKKAGAKVSSFVFKNITSNDIFESIEMMKTQIDACDIFALSGGFSAGDEPDGSGKFIACVLNNKIVKEAIERLLARKGLILGICNGFQALVKSGLLPDAKLGSVTKDSPTLFRNDINRHISQMVQTKVMSNKSVWLSSYRTGEIHNIAVSHGEGKFVVSKEMAKQLFANGQVAFCYTDMDGEETIESPYNPNGSYYAIEGITSADGLILGKMGHSERCEENVCKNIYGDKVQNIFQNAVNYFKIQE